MVERCDRGDRSVQKVGTHLVPFAILDLDDFRRAFMCQHANRHTHARFAQRHSTALDNASWWSKFAFGSTLGECRRLLDALLGCAEHLRAHGEQRAARRRRDLFCHNWSVTITQCRSFCLRSRASVTVCLRFQIVMRAPFDRYDNRTRETAGHVTADSFEFEQQSSQLPAAGNGTTPGAAAGRAAALL